MFILKTIKNITFLRIILGFNLCLLSFWAHAQDLYLWNAVTIDGIESRSSVPDYYEMYNLSLNTGEITFKFSLLKEDFDHGNMSGEAFFIASFAMNQTRDTVYFLEDEGDLYQYSTIDASLKYLIDLTPLNSSPAYHILNIVDQIDFINSSELLVTGKIEGIFNINTNEFTKFDNCIEPCYVENNTKSTIRHKGKYISKNYSSKLLSYYENDPYEFDEIFEFDEISFGHLFEQNNDCSAFDLMYLEYNFNNFPVEDSIKISKLNLFNNQQIEVDNLAGFPNDITPYENDILDIQHYSSLPWEDCQRRIDLDADDNTTGGLDFLLDSLCQFNRLQLSDIDISISNEYPIDSIVIQIMNPLASQNINIENGNYLLGINNNSWQTIINNGNTTVENYEEAIRNSYLNMNPAPNITEVQIRFTVWYNGISGQYALATLKFAIPLPFAGDDVVWQFCEGDSNLIISNILAPNADDGGTFFDSQYEEVLSLSTYPAPYIDSIYYVASNGICNDTAQIINIINPIPSISPLPDYNLCHDEVQVIDLSIYLEDIKWNDNSKEKIRVLDQNGTYVYELKNNFGCSNVDSFNISLLDQTYIKISGELEFCLDENTVLEVISGHDELILNGNSVNPVINIDEAGIYSLEGYDMNGCIALLNFNVGTHPKPTILTEDLIDTIFSPDLALPVSYEGEIETYYWTPNLSLNCSDCPFPKFITQEEGIYTIEVINEYGCKSINYIQVSFVDRSLSIPNIISNNSNIPQNGNFYLQGNSIFKYELYIFDRWGNILFKNLNAEANREEDGWQPRGSVNSGVFVYMIKYIENNKTKIITGDITVID